MDTNKLITENAVEAIITARSDGKIYSWNPAAEKIFGYRADEAIGKSFTRLFPVPPGEKLEILPMPKKEPFNTRRERRIIHRDGHFLPVEFMISHVGSQKGMIYLIFARDISKRWLRETKLTQSYQNQRIMNSILTISLLPIPLEDQLEMVLDQILTIPTVKLLPNGAILLVDENSQTLKLSAQRNFSQQQIETCTQVPFGKCHCGRAALSGEIQFVECIDEGHDFIFDKMSPHGHYCVPIITGGQVLGVIALYIEEGHKQNQLEIDSLTAISNILAGAIERKKMENQLVDLVDNLRDTIGHLDVERRFNESVFVSLNSGLLVLDQNDRVEKCNPAGLELIKLFSVQKSGVKLIGRNLSELFGPEGMQAFTVINDAGSSERRELKLTDLNGTERIIEFATVPREDFSGSKLGTIISFQDVTSLKKIQTEMEKMNRFSTIAEIASAVAHEVRNPLAGIRTMSQAIGEKLDDGDEKKEYITRVIKQVDRLNLLLTDFFTYARPPEPKREKTSLIKIIDEIKPLIHNRLFKFGIELREEYADNLPEIMVDPNQMQQVFLNLMLNSIEAIKHRGKIEITARYIGLDRSTYTANRLDGLLDNREYVIVEFSDDGVGIPPEQVDKVIEPFFTTKHDGSGLGLAIVYRILQENNAGITIEKKSGPGTEMTMFFSVN